MPRSVSIELVYQSLDLMSGLGVGDEMISAALAGGMTLGSLPSAERLAAALGSSLERPIPLLPKEETASPGLKEADPIFTPSRGEVVRATPTALVAPPYLRTLGWDGATVAITPKGGYVQLRLTERALVTQTNRFGNYNFVGAQPEVPALSNASGPEITIQMSPAEGSFGDTTSQTSKYHLRLGGGITNYRDGQHVPPGDPVVTFTSPSYVTVTRLEPSIKFGGDRSAGPASRLEIIALLGLEPGADKAPGLMIRNEKSAGAQ